MDIARFVEEFREDPQNDMLYREIQEINRSSHETEPVDDYILRVLRSNHE